MLQRRRLPPEGLRLPSCGLDDRGMEAADDGTRMCTHGGRSAAASRADQLVVSVLRARLRAR